MLTKISPYISSLVSEHVSKLVGKNKSILVDTETGMLYYKDKKNQTKLLPNQDANLIKIYINNLSSFEVLKIFHPVRL